MEDEGILDPLDDVHLVALHHVYRAKIQEKLDICNKAWSQHRMRTTRSSPIRMWVAGQLQNPVGLELRSELIPHYGVGRTTFGRLFPKSRALDRVRG